MLKYKIFIITLATTLIYCLFFAVFVKSVNAEDLTVLGNGSDSGNGVSVYSPTQTSVQQANTATISNTIETTSSSGNNTANSNTNGSVVISTGDTISNTTIINNTNNSVAKAPSCCSGTTLSTNDQNGSGSQNTIVQDNSTKVNTVVKQITTIQNNISGTAITGENSANDNSGNTTIQTGDINVKIRLLNEPLATISAGKDIEGSEGSVVDSSGNGDDSKNTVDEENNNINMLKTIQVTNASNNETLSLSSGSNTASGNTGNVEIQTGNIASYSQISNNPLNTNVFDGDCQCTQQSSLPAASPKSETPGALPPPFSAAPIINSLGSNSSTFPSGGQVLVLGMSRILPATETNWLFFAILANIVMLFMRMWIRLRSGRSPNHRYSL